MFWSSLGMGRNPFLCPDWFCFCLPAAPDLSQGCEKTGTAQAAKILLDWEAGADPKKQICDLSAFFVIPPFWDLPVEPKGFCLHSEQLQGMGSFSSVILLEMSLYLFLAHRSSDKRTVGSYNYFKAKWCKLEQQEPEITVN